jgi:hypothetical protein
VTGAAGAGGAAGLAAAVAPSPANAVAAARDRQSARRVGWGLVWILM